MHKMSTYYRSYWHSLRKPLPLTCLTSFIGGMPWRLIPGKEAIPVSGPRPWWLP
jgi:hypothetical protein